MQLTCPSCGCAYAADQAGGLCPRCLAGMAGQMSDTPVEETPIDPGETFHGLLVQKLVARGGMGVIYRARQPVSNRDVALKILPRSLASEEEFRLRFDREARALAGLSHPNIVNLYDYGVDGDLMFLVMEFVEGVSLRECLRERRLGSARAVKIALDLCEALQFAHREGIIHRDIKPENVLIDRTGRIKLTDFGLAKRVNTDSTQLTQTHLAVGTPHYMAPEQLEQPKDIDHRVDIYSLGVLLYEMLTRELPIGRFPAPSSKEGVDERLDDIVYRCLEKDPDRRYPDVSKLKAALLSTTGRMDEAPISGLPEERPSPARPKVASNLPVNCACGWEFYVPAAARGMVHCPSCGEPVRLSDPTPAAPRPGTTRRSVAPPSARAPRRLLVAAALLTILVVVFLCLVLMPRAARRENDSQDVAAAPPRPAPIEIKSQTPPAAPLPELPLLSRTPPEAPPVRPSVAPAELRRQLGVTVAQSNMAGLVSTILLNSGRPLDYEQLQGRIRQFDGEIQELVLRLQEQGLIQETPERFRSGDKLSAFAGRRVDPSRTIAFADDLRAWLRAFRPGATESVVVVRNRQNVSYQMSFPERAPELVALAHQAGLVLGETPGYIPTPAEPKPSPLAPIPVAILTETRQKLAALPAFYRNALPYEERGRAEALLLGGKGTGEDTLFLTGRFSDLLRKGEIEQAGFAARVRELEAKIADPAMTTDTVVCKDRKIEGTILEETENSVKVKARFGAVTINRSEILSIEKGKGSAAEFRAAYQTSRGQKTELLKLLALAKEKKLPVHQELAAFAVLALDPADERCRAEAGLSRNPFAGAPDPEPGLTGDRIEYRGKQYTPEQLRQELKSVGYVQMNGLWCEKIAKSYRIDNLYRNTGTLQGANIQSQTHTEKDTAYDYRSKSWIPKTKLVTTARYVGTGTCFIEIAAPGDVVEARVHARSQVARVGGSVTVSVVTDPRDTGYKILYSLGGPGENDGQHDATEKVYGFNRFYVRADIKGDGMFLISDQDDLSVFEVKYTYAKPLERINALFAASRETSVEAGVEQKSTNDTVESTCRNLASSAAQNGVLVDALSEVRKQTDGLVYSREFVMPSRFSDVSSPLKDPLYPDWNALTREQALKLGTWWGGLGLDERREFLTAYGIWCARTRYSRTPK